MSFILDALKKAERERSLARVPSLSTVHIPVITTGRRFRLWAVAGLFLIAGGFSVWLWRPSLPVASVPATNPRSQAATTLPAGPADPALAPTPARIMETLPPVSVAPASPPSAVAEQRMDRQQTSPAPAAVPPSIQAPKRQSPPSDFQAAASSGGIRGGGGRSPGISSGQAPDGPSPPTESAPIQPPPVFTVPAPVTPAPRPAGPPVPPQTMPSPGANPPPAVVVAPSSPPKPATPPTLVDAMAKMKLDLFVYTDVPKDRMVIINGRKYFEGDEVDGLYLIKSITPDGALLIYQDESLLLRP
jgi:type II secretion system (T2SS) protein B